MAEETTSSSASCWVEVWISDTAGERRKIGERKVTGAEGTGLVLGNYTIVRVPEAISRISKNQSTTLAALCTYVERNGASPSIAELRAAAGFTSMGTLFRAIKALEVRGYLIRGRGPRAIAPSDVGRDYWRVHRTTPARGARR